jgi:cobalt-zinc-cadmium efflux system outer membrane protein
MPLTRLLPLTALVLLSGCVYGVREKADQVQCDLSLKTYDLAPPGQAAAPRPGDAPEKLSPPKAAVPTDVQTTALMQAGEPKKPLTPEELAAQRLQVPGVIPGSETQLPDFKGMTEGQRREAIKKLFPDMPALEPEPAAQPGPGGKPYTLADLQLLAARYSPALKQAISDVEAARGTMLQARAYPNPTIAYEADPSSSGTGGPTFEGISIDQPIKTAGKLKLQEAAARMDYLNAELALRRARSDLSTQVRNAYFGLLVTREALRVNRGVARLTDEVFLIQRDLSESLAAYYEAGTLRAQAGQARLAYQQSLFAYQAAWRTLVAAVGLRERDMPLAEVAGRIDAFVPLYDYDKVLARVLTTHTDVLSAQNGIEKARYSLKLQQITPWFQDMDVQLKVQKDFTTPPGQVVPSVTIGMPLPVWDQNKGNVIAAEAAMVRAREQPHAAELTLTNNVTTAFSSYRQNLQALEDYRRTILPFQVLAYRGVFFRRAQVGAVGRTPVAFADLVTAQQALTQSVSTYLGILGTLWTSVVSVADALQTDDLFQLAEPQSLPPIPDLDHLAPLPCGHDCPAGAAAPCGHEVPAHPALPAAAPEIVPASEPRPGGTEE